ncbi:hypothetical protein GCM10011521_13260 [Arenimonas soli]|uniref:DUF4785 domain-containing protein n=1 Tax=Arenimonas soli TaxID=2269504 RepID=A0ABQ1HI72_9GAMM|nr:DUF4785 domain-containing protein [Arenimonas soli]GGA76376.1 hypothetical protein GCM10011521_13260 [Arenimonas soli]
MKKTLVACLATLAFSSAQAGTLLPPGTADQQPSQLIAAPLPKGDFERKPVAVAWAMDPAAELATAPPHRVQSREYWAAVDAGQLKSGFPLTTTAPGALVRISPQSGAKSAAVDPGEVRLLRNGRPLPATAFKRLATTDQLRKAGMDVSDGTAIVQLDPSTGQGRFDLQLGQASGRYLVHVFEPNSELVLVAQSERSRLLAGDRIEVAASLQRGKSALAGNVMQAQLVSPSGRSWPLAVRNGKATGQLPLDADPTPGLWEVQLFAGAASKDGPVQRDARTAIEVSRPTARLGGGYAFDPGAVSFSLPVQVAAPGRYELRGVLYATGPRGVMQPVAQAHSANWLEAGQRKLDLTFGPANLPMGYGAPFELRFLELKDQTRLGTLETRELALREGVRRPRPVIAGPRER